MLLAWQGALICFFKKRLWQLTRIKLHDNKSLIFKNVKRSRKNITHTHTRIQAIYIIKLIVRFLYKNVIINNHHLHIYIYIYIWLEAPFCS